MSDALFSFRSLAFSAFRAGGLVSVVFRPSSRSFSGWVAVVRFRRRSAAVRFARRWAGRLGVGVAVRGGGLFVSVPVAAPRSSRPAGLGRPVVAVGGLRALVASLGAAGLVS